MIQSTHELAVYDLHISWTKCTCYIFPINVTSMADIRIHFIFSNKYFSERILIKYVWMREWNESPEWKCIESSLVYNEYYERK